MSRNLFLINPIGLIWIIGYSIQWGLTFPLFYSSVFLSEMELSHGAGSSFGALFVICYVLGFALTATYTKFTSKTNSFLHLLLSCLLMTGIGNLLMFFISFGLFEFTYGYAIVTALLVGIGLAGGEVFWILVCQNLLGFVSSSQKVSYLSVSFFIGGVISGLIFLLPGYVEIVFALVLVTVSVLLVIALESGYSKSKITLKENTISDSIFELGDKNVIRLVGLIRAGLFLSVFSFVFGAIGQISTLHLNDLMPLIVSTGCTLVVAFICIALSKYWQVDRLQPTYNVIFPFIAVTLFASALVTDNVSSALSTSIVFLIFVWSLINIHQILFLLMPMLKIHLIASLFAFSSLMVLCGVQFGKVLGIYFDDHVAIALTALGSVIILSCVPFVMSIIEKMMMKKQGYQLQNSSSKANVLEEMSLKYGLSERELDVLRLMVKGRSRNYIASELYLSPNTVKGYMHTLYQKCNVNKKQDLLDLYESMIAKHS